jgi:paraquat-inducible protein A
MNMITVSIMLVVVMTMFSAMMFDPRLLWDREPDPSHEEMQQHGK